MRLLISSSSLWILVNSLLLQFSHSGNAKDSSMDWSWESEDSQEEYKPKRWSKDGLCDHDPVTAIVLKYLLHMQETMKNGDPSKNLEPMNPLSISQLSTTILKDEKNGGRGIILNLTNILIKDYTSFNITHMTADLDHLCVNASLVVGAMNISGQYSMNGRYYPSRYLPLPIFGEGEIFLNPENISSTLFVKFLSENGTLVLQDFDYSINVNELKIRFTGFMNAGRRLNKFMSKLVNQIGLRLLDRIEKRIHQRVRSGIIRRINGVLEDWEHSFDLTAEFMNHSMRCLFG